MTTRRLTCLIGCASTERFWIEHELFATGTTGGLLEEELGISVAKLQSGPLGGYQQIGARIVEGLIDFLIFFLNRGQSVASTGYISTHSVGGASPKKSSSPRQKGVSQVIGLFTRLDLAKQTLKNTAFSPVSWRKPNDQYVAKKTGSSEYSMVRDGKERENH